MSTPAVTSAALVASPELLRLLDGLSSDLRFAELMAVLEARCTGLAVWGHHVPDATQRLWVGGRVQELTDLLVLYAQAKRRRTERPDVPTAVPVPEGAFYE